MGSILTIRAARRTPPPVHPLHYLPTFFPTHLLIVFVRDESQYDGHVVSTNPTRSYRNILTRYDPPRTKIAFRDRKKLALAPDVFFLTWSPYLSLRLILIFFRFLSTTGVFVRYFFLSTGRSMLPPPLLLLVAAVANGAGGFCCSLLFGQFFFPLLIFRLVKNMPSNPPQLRKPKSTVKRTVFLSLLY